MTIAINFTKYIYGGVISMKRSYTALRKMLLTVTLIVVSSSSYASFMTGSTLNEWIYDYERADGLHFNRGVLSGYVTGVVDLGDGVLFCLPANATAGQSIAVVIKYVKDHPEQWNKNGAGLVVSALKEVFPCQNTR